MLLNMLVKNSNLKTAIWLPVVLFLALISSIHAKEVANKLGQDGDWEKSPVPSAMIDRIRILSAESQDIVIVSPYEISTKILTGSKAIAIHKCRIVKVVKGKLEFGKRIIVHCFYEPEPDEKDSPPSCNATGEFRILFMNYEQQLGASAEVETDGWSFPLYRKELETAMPK